MPPRRRRNRSRPQLTFIESPRHKVHKLPSPVFASDHPARADVIPIDSTVFPWVSPQFKGPASARKTRRRARRASQYDSVSADPPTRRTSNGSPTRVTRSRSYVPILMSVDPDPPGQNSTAVVSKPREPTADNRRYSTRSQNNREITSTEANIDGDNITHSHGHIDNTEQPNGQDLTLIRPKGQGAKKRSRLVFDSHVADESTGSPQQEYAGGNVLYSPSAGGVFENVDTPPACTHSTPSKPQDSGERMTPAKGSPTFRRRSNRNKRNDSSTASKPLLKVNKNMPNQYSPVYGKRSNRNSNNHSSTPLKPLHSATNSSLCSSPLRDSPVFRRSARKTRNVFKGLGDSTLVCDCDKDEECPRVLVYDTPESEYGKGMRWRQLNQRNKSRNRKAP